MTRFAFPGGTALRFPTDVGTVWAIVKDRGGGRAVLEVSEETAALAAWHDASEIVRTGDSAEMKAARNRFGTGRILTILRAVREAMPSVVEWVYERTGGANPWHEKRRA